MASKLGRSLQGVRSKAEALYGPVLPPSVCRNVELSGTLVLSCTDAFLELAGEIVLGVSFLATPARSLTQSFIKRPCASSMSQHCALGTGTGQAQSLPSRAPLLLRPLCAAVTHLILSQACSPPTQQATVMSSLDSLFCEMGTEGHTVQGKQRGGRQTYDGPEASSLLAE